MTTEANKAIVLRFIKEVLGGGNIDLIDELLAPDYVNPSMGVTNREWLQGCDFRFEGRLHQHGILKSRMW